MVQLGGAGCPSIQRYYLFLKQLLQYRIYCTVLYMPQIYWSLIHVCLEKMLYASEWVQWKKSESE